MSRAGGASAMQARARCAAGLVALVVVAACTDGTGDAARGGPPDPAPVAGAERVEVLGAEGRYLVDLLDAAADGRHIVVRGAGAPPLDAGARGRARSIAERAGALMGCRDGSGLALVAGSGAFGPLETARGPVAQGRPVWHFRGQCGG